MEDQCTKPRSLVRRIGRGALLAISLLLLLVSGAVLGADPVTVPYDRIDGVAPELLSHGEIQRLLGAPSAAVQPEKRARVEELSERVAAFFDRHLKTDSNKLQPRENLTE
jgi:hypothetical protein